MKSSKFVIVSLICIALLLPGGIPVKAQQEYSKFFSQTGHNVAGEFWTFYQGIPDAEIVFGMPITEQFTTRDGAGLTVQYFEHARFELHQDQPVGQRVQMTSLGAALYNPNSLSVNLTTPGACRVFANGFGVCYDFLSFYDTYGGQARFGSPISAFEFLPDGRIVQYFERARFEWHPEYPLGQKVILTDLGRLYFNLHEDPSWLAPARAIGDVPAPFVPPTSLRVLAFVEKAVTLPSDTQKIFVVVQDQALNPVANASGTVTMRLPDGTVLAYPILTDANGVGIIPAITFYNQPSGSLVQVDVSIDFLGIKANSTTSFRIWR